MCRNVAGSINPPTIIEHGPGASSRAKTKRSNFVLQSRDRTFLFALRPTRAYLERVHAPQGMKPILKRWMELS